jgi:hypothetical protein
MRACALLMKPPTKHIHTSFLEDIPPGYHSMFLKLAEFYGVESAKAKVLEVARTAPAPKNRCRIVSRNEL